MRRQKADFFDHALMAAVVGFVIGALWVADANAQSYTTFPNLRSGNMDFTATIRANGSACASGTAIVSGGGSVTCVAVIPTSQKGANNGVATLDSGGKVPTAQLPFSGLTYDGSWNATTNSPTLADGTGTSGHFYITSVAGTQNLGSGSITFAVGDWTLYNGTVWQKVPSSAAVSSVFGRTGAVTATAGDYTATQVTNTPAGGIAATTAQAAINELDTEKQAAASTLTSWAALTRASGFDTFTQTPSSANLRGLLTDEVGTGAAYFVGGALGTPASATLTNGTGLPWSTGLTGVPTTASGYGITGGAKLDAYAGGDTPSAFTLGIVDSVDAAAWRAAIGAGTSSATGTVTSVSGSGGSTGLTLTGGPITTTGTLTLGGTLADGSLSSNVPLKNAGNAFTASQSITVDGLALTLNTVSGGGYMRFSSAGTPYGYIGDRSQVIGSGSGLALRSDGALYFSAGGTTERVAINSAGNVTINAPSSGTTLTVSGLDTQVIAAFVDTTSTSGVYMRMGDSVGSRGYMGFGPSTFSGAAISDFGIAAANGVLRFSANGGTNTHMQVSAAGNVTVAAPSSGTALTVNPVAANYGIATGKLRTGDDVLATGANVVSTGTDPMWIGSIGAASAGLYTNSVQRVVASSAGNVTINAPSSGNTLTLGTVVGSTTIVVNGDMGSGSGLFVGNTSTTDGRAVVEYQSTRTSTKNFTLGIDPDGGNSKRFALRDVTRGAIPIEVSTSGNVTVNAPSSSSAFVVNGVADGGGGTAWTSELIGSSSSGHSLGLRVRAGTTSGDSALRVMDASNSNLYLDVAGNGGVQIGAPTGGNPGVGGLNVDGVLQKDGVNVCLSDGTNCPGGGGVTSITGTANQVIASASTGAVTLSTPQSIGTSSSVQFGSFGVGTSASGTSGEIRATNNVTAYYSSDRRLKENVQAIPDALSKVEAIRGVTFDWTPEYIASHGGEDAYFMRKHDVGVIAQEVEAVLPEVVATREDGYKAVKYDRLVALLIESVKDLKAQNDELYERVKKLEGAR